MNVPSSLLPRPSAFSWLACPADRTSPLDLAVEKTASAPGKGAGDERVANGTLSCTACGRNYPVQDGIPRLLPDPSQVDREEAAAKSDERRQRDREARIYDRNLLLRMLTAAEAPATLGRLGVGPEDTLLEVGCGTGRFTARLAQRCRTILAVDHSHASLCVARAKLAGQARSNVLFVQADASYLPVRSGWASRALSCQMLEHLPTGESRQRAVNEMARALKPGGRLVLSAYWHPPLLARWLPKEGRHSGQIYFYRFSRAELAALLGHRVRLRGMTGRLVYILLADGVKVDA